jgi:Fe-S cluster biogenesis protein NfuA
VILLYLCKTKTGKFFIKYMNSINERIEAALEGIRPYLKADGGNVQIVEITDDNVVRVELMGACGSCSMSMMTFRAGIEDAIKKAVPEVSRVEALNLTPAF